MTYDLNTLSAARLWEFQPDWSSGYELRRAFATDIIRSRNGTEQRRALRDAPRLSATYQTSLDDADYREARHYLRVWQNNPSAVPDFSRWDRTTASSANGATTLTITTPPAWVNAGSHLLLCAEGILELVEVVTVAAPTITLALPLGRAWPSASVIRPVLFGLLSGSVGSDRARRGAARMSVGIQAYPGGEPIEDEGTADLTYNGYEVLTTEPDWKGAAGLQYIHPVERVDFGLGRTAQFRPVELPQQLIEAQFSGLSPSEAQELEQFFLRMKGRRGAFYRPSGENDLPLHANVTASANVTITGRWLADDLGSFDFSANPTMIEIVQIDGTRIHRRINSIALVSGNSRLTLNSAVTITTATTARISWMPLCRFGSDEMATRWTSMLHASIRASFQTVTA